jgi:hypothetical protein
VFNSPTNFLDPSGNTIVLVPYAVGGLLLIGAAAIHYFNPLQNQPNSVSPFDNPESPYPRSLTFPNPTPARPETEIFPEPDWRSFDPNAINRRKDFGDIGKICRNLGFSLHPDLFSPNDINKGRTFDRFLPRIFLSIKEVEIDSNKYPESAQHVRDAQASGYPEELTIDRSGASKNRRDSLRGVDTVSGKDRDEYPPAVFGEGGSGSSVRPINPSDNRGAGSTIGHQIKGLPDGTKVRIIVTP